MVLRPRGLRRFQRWLRLRARRRRASLVVRAEARSAGVESVLEVGLEWLDSAAWWNRALALSARQGGDRNGEGVEGSGVTSLVSPHHVREPMVAAVSHANVAPRFIFFLRSFAGFQAALSVRPSHSRGTAWPHPSPPIPPRSSTSMPLPSPPLFLSSPPSCPASHIMPSPYHALSYEAPPALRRRTTIGCSARSSSVLAGTAIENERRTDCTSPE